MQAAAATRAKAKLDQAGMIWIYGLCETLGVTVRFNNINMEGMYQRGLLPRIHLSARRPLPRRAALWNLPASMYLSFENGVLQSKGYEKRRPTRNSFPSAALEVRR